MQCKCNTKMQLINVVQDNEDILWLIFHCPHCGRLYKWDNKIITESYWLEPEIAKQCLC